jgi:NAD(P)H dehydrogenase (quinone)
VGHVVYTSFVGAAPDATFTLARDHWATEEHLRASGLPYTFLRDNLYADFLPLMVGDDGALRGPADEGRAAVVTQDDIADVAAAVLSTGLRREIRYVPESLDEAYRSRAGYGAPGWQVDAWVSTYTAIAVGELAQVTDHVEQLTGHPATSLADLLLA